MNTSPHPATSAPPTERRALDRQILALAVPALGALIAEPVLLLIDTAMVGHLGTADLAGLSLASAILLTGVGIFIFLAYATTATTSRLFGAGNHSGALRAGIDGMWLAVGLGVATGLFLYLAGPWLIAAMGGTGEVAGYAGEYLRMSSFGLPGMLLVLAATGVLRGMLDTRTPLVVAAAACALNAGLNAALIYGAGMGVAGAGLGTALAQTAAGLVLAGFVIGKIRGNQVSLLPSGLGVLSAVSDGVPLLIRTLTLRAALLATVAAATALGPVELAAHQIVNSLWSFAAFALDALAIAAQALVGRGLGAGEESRVRRILRRCLQWGAGAGVVLGVLFAGLGFLLVRIFTSDPAVRHDAMFALIIAGAMMWLAGVVYMYDGVLIGAGDGPFLAKAGLITIAAYLPCVWLLTQYGPQGTAGIVALWVIFTVVFMGARALTMWVRSRGTKWIVLGERRN